MQQHTRCTEVRQLSGLLGLKLIHFARWVIIRPNQWPDPAGQRSQNVGEW